MWKLYTHEALPFASRHTVLVLRNQIKAPVPPENHFGVKIETLLVRKHFLLLLSVFHLSKRMYSDVSFLVDYTHSKRKSGSCFR